MLSGTKCAGPHQRRHRRLRARRQRDQILDEHDPDDVVEVVAVDRHPRVLLLPEQRAQILQRGVGANRNDVGARRHDLADDGLGEVDDRLQQLAAFLLGDRSLPPARRRWRAPASSTSEPLRRLRSRARGAAQTRLMIRAVIGTSSVRDRVKGRQEDVEHALGIAPHDEHRQQVLADDDEGDQRDDERDDRERVVNVAEPRDEEPARRCRRRSGCGPG